MKTKHFQRPKRDNDESRKEKLEGYPGQASLAIAMDIIKTWLTYKLGLEIPKAEGECSY